MTDTPLIRAARALMRHHDIDPDVFVGMHGGYSDWPDAARAVLEAVREPDDFMVRAGIIERHEAEVPEAWSKATANIYTAMIDAALSE